jgi:hypothetical protein
MTDLTLDQVKRALPVNMKTAASQSLTDQINNLVADPLIAEHIREHFVTFAVVLQEGKWGMEAYINAIQYVTYKMMGYTNQDSYFRTFPQRQADFITKGTSAKDIAAYVAQYHKGKLVNAILEKSLIPIHLLYQDTYFAAIKVQAELMNTAVSEKVRCEAANSILTHLAKPKEAAVQVAVTVNQTAEMDAMQTMLANLGRRQLELIAAGVPASELAAQRLVEAPVEMGETIEGTAVILEGNA